MISDITKVDKNFAAKSVIYDGMTVYHISEEPFKIYGIYRSESGDFLRMPSRIAESISDGVKQLYNHTAGGRIRFKTDSKKIVLRSILPYITNFNHMPLTGSSCFDLYVNGQYRGPFNFGTAKKSNKTNEFICEAVLSLSKGSISEVLINFPLYNPVKDIYIALDEGATLEESKGYLYDEPIVFYGSSITQGGCASHAGNSYEAIISRNMNIDYINLGFSGFCKGELAMAEYISSLDMKAFVMDYDHNALTPEYLKETHYAFYKCIRDKKPNLPILVVSAADLYWGDDIEKRKAVIEDTYNRALKNGDKNIYYLDGQTIYKEIGTDYCTVDFIHPNDTGFLCMARAIGVKLEKMLEQH